MCIHDKNIEICVCLLRLDTRLDTLQVLTVKKLLDAAKILDTCCSSSGF